MALGGPPFSARFFLTVFRDWIRSKCSERQGEVPVVLIHVADGRVLDLCHIQLITPLWLAVAAYRDAATCKDMNTEFIPFSSICGVTISKREGSNRKIGFHVEKSLPALAQLGATEEAIPK